MVSSLFPINDCFEGFCATFSPLCLPLHCLFFDVFFWFWHVKALQPENSHNNHHISVCALISLSQLGGAVLIARRKLNVYECVYIIPQGNKAINLYCRWKRFWTITFVLIFVNMCICIFIAFQCPFKWIHTNDIMDIYIINLPASEKFWTFDFI